MKSGTSQKLLDDAIVSLFNNNLYEFSSCISQLYRSYLTCNCFIRRQPNSIWKSLLVYVTFAKNNNVFEYYFTVGFILLMHNDEKRAYKYLTKAINLNSTNGISYLLRSKCKCVQLKYRLNDAKIAVNMELSVHGLFNLASLTSIQNDFKALDLYNEILQLNSDVACVYNNKAIIYMEMRDFISSFINFRKCIEIEPKHWCYYSFWKCCYKSKDYKNALKYIKLGIKYNPKQGRYHKALAKTYFKLKKYNQAYKCINKAIEKYPSSHKEKLFQIKVKEAYEAELLWNALNAYFLESYKKSVANWEIYFSSKIEISSHELIGYFEARLKMHNPNIILQWQNNLHFVQLNKLWSECKRKKEKNETLNIEESEIESLNISRGLELIEIDTNDELSSSIRKTNNIPWYMLSRNVEKPVYFINLFLYSTSVLVVDSNEIILRIINCLSYAIDPFILLNKTLQSDPDYYKALEINMAKYYLRQNMISEYKEYKSSAIEFEDDYVDSENKGGIDNIEADDILREWAYEAENENYWPSYEEWLRDEFGDGAETAYWNLD